MSAPSPLEVMTVVAARMLRDRMVCCVGVGVPSKAASLARLTHAPGLVLIYDSGIIGARPNVLPLSVGDGALAATADTLVSVPEMFAYWLQGGRVDVGFLGAAQVDRFGNLNSTVIGAYHQPRVRLPGAGGAPDIAAHARETLIVIEHDQRRLVEKVDFITTAGHLGGGDARREAGLATDGPVAVVTDLAVLKPDAQSRELMVAQLHPGVTRDQVTEATGWPVGFMDDLTMTEPPTEFELSTLRDLERRTERAHAAPASADARGVTS